ncbi:hypothetical protein [Actinoallomurus sp. NPDC050550]|uniref:hypothetical protein n=1 Tax=Actinoallomurus sp. NPDC050550 TaxID=3154937 RepID=UPI0033E15610
MGEVDDLAPWRYVVNDVAERFAPVRHQAESVPSRWHVIFSAPDGGRRRSYAAHFVWGLLQAVEELPGCVLGAHPRVRQEHSQDWPIMYCSPSCV